MTNFKNEKRSVVSRWQVVLGVIPALFLGACAEETTAPPMDHITARIIDNQTGATREVTGAIDMFALESAIDDNTTEKAGCTHIRFCTTTFVDTLGHKLSNAVVCDTNDQVCSSSSRFSECNSDANFVCGKTRPMAFDPPIPCPITGISTSVCGTGESLIWLTSSTAHIEL